VGRGGTRFSYLGVEGGNLVELGMKRAVEHEEEHLAEDGGFSDLAWRKRTGEGGGIKENV